MEYTSFILGVLSVIFILMVVGIFRISQRVNKTESGISAIQEGNRNFYTDLNDVHRRINEVSELDNRRIDGEIDRTNKLVDDIYRLMDSRFDKLENKLKTGNSKQLLKD